jgi:16S rRNA pseudouridine516 synthase
VLDKYLARLGYGTRREVGRLFDVRRVTRVDGTVLKASDAAAHEFIRFDGAPLDPAPGAVILLHKPIGYVCSAKDVQPLIYELLPPRFLARTPIIAPIGRLDLDTTGLLLLTDDGPLNHRVASPRTHLPKTYDATLAQDLRGDEAERFASGTLLLERETDALKPAVLEVLTPRSVRLTVTEGRYHQVRRMFAAMGNHVVTLHRSALGPLTLGTLAPGEWRVITDGERAALETALSAALDSSKRAP